MKKKIIPLALILITGSVFLFLRLNRNAGLVLPGEVEGSIYSQTAEVPGKIVEMNIELGSSVKAGDLIVRLDSTDQKYALEQMLIALEKRRLVLKSLLKGVKQEELEKARNDVSIAEANVHSAEATYIQARDDAEALAQLLNSGGVSKSELDKARLRELTAADALEAARRLAAKAGEQFSLLRKGADEETIALAEADIADMESRLAQMRKMLEKYEISASCDGVVISKNYGLGSIVNAGYIIADISADREKYVVCYVPKEDSMQISYGQIFTVKAGKNEYKGEVRFIDVKSQYTPKDMQTSATRNKVSVKVKLLLPPGASLKSGNKAEVVIGKP